MEKKDKKEEQFGVSLPESKADVLFSDAAMVTSSPFGVVIDFGQKVGPTNNVRIVSRIGLSREHVEKLLEVLKNHIMLPKGKEKKESTRPEFGFRTG